MKTRKKSKFVTFNSATLRQHCNIFLSCQPGPSLLLFLCSVYKLFNIKFLTRREDSEGKISSCNHNLAIAMSFSMGPKSFILDFSSVGWFWWEEIWNLLVYHSWHYLKELHLKDEYAVKYPLTGHFWEVIAQERKMFLWMRAGRNSSLMGNMRMFQAGHRTLTKIETFKLTDLYIWKRTWIKFFSGCIWLISS